MKGKPGKMTLSDLKRMWDQSASMPLKDRRKAYRSACHFAVELGLNTDLDSNDIDFCIDVIRTCLPVLSYPTAIQNRLTKIYIRKLALTGIDDPEPVLLSKKSGNVGIDSGTLMIADTSFLDDRIEDYRNWSRVSSEGGAYFISTGGDGIAAAQLRVIDFPFPALSVRETRFGRDQSDARIIHVPSGKIVVSDPVYHDVPEYSILDEVEPGYSQLSVFVFESPGKVFSYYFVMCRPDGPHTNTVQAIQELYQAS